MVYAPMPVKELVPELLHDGLEGREAGGGVDVGFDHEGLGARHRVRLDVVLGARARSRRITQVVRRDHVVREHRLALGDAPADVVLGDDRHESPEERLLQP
jgi:hypothetical protein